MIGKPRIVLNGPYPKSRWMCFAGPKGERVVGFGSSPADAYREWALRALARKPPHWTDGMDAGCKLGIP